MATSCGVQGAGYAAKADRGIGHVWRAHLQNGMGRVMGRDNEAHAWVMIWIPLQSSEAAWGAVGRKRAAMYEWGAMMRRNALGCARREVTRCS